MHRFLITNFTEAKLTRSLLRLCDFSHANFTSSTFYQAKVAYCNFSKALLVSTDFRGAILHLCRVFGVSAWDININTNTKQYNLIVTRENQPIITVDDIEVAQLIYLFIHNANIRRIFDVLTSKAVLILGRFTDERKEVLEAVAESLRQLDYVPIIFDFDPSENRDLTETIELLARLCRFIIADITDSKSIIQELSLIVRATPSIPIQPIMKRGEIPWSMYKHLTRYPWVLDTIEYESLASLVSNFDKTIVQQVELKFIELNKVR